MFCGRDAAEARNVGLLEGREKEEGRTARGDGFGRLSVWKRFSGSGTIKNRSEIKSWSGMDPGRGLGERC